MEYAYIKRSYGATFCPGDRVEHQVTGKAGEVMSPDQSALHYVQVSFDDRTGLCHPQELKIIARGAAWSAAIKEMFPVAHLTFPDADMNSMAEYLFRHTAKDEHQPTEEKEEK